MAYYDTSAYQPIDEPDPGAYGVGYVRPCSEFPKSDDITVQKQRIKIYAQNKGWKIVHWYEEAEGHALHEELEYSPNFSQLLEDAGALFQVVLCDTVNCWSRKVPLAYSSLAHLYRQHVWWATADGTWDINKVYQQGIQICCQFKSCHPVKFSSRLKEKN